MTSAATLILVLYAGGLLSLLWNVWKTWRLLRTQRVGTALPQQPGGAPPALDVLVPVKDEEQNIGECLRSLLAQQYPHLRVIVVNDRSTDGTAAVVQAVQDRHPNVERVDIAELPADLYGKPHALASVAARLRAEILAFVDSDLVLQPDCLGRLVGHLRAANLDWVATMGAPEIRTFWERVIVPVFGAVCFAWYDPRRISDPAWPNAIGSALMVCRRTSYEAIGGHGAVTRIYDEDSELVRIAKRAGQRVSFVLTPELFTQRHYGTLVRTIRGITRTFVGGIKTIPRLFLTLSALNFVSLLPLEIAILAAIAAAAGVTVPWMPLWSALAAVHYAIATALAWLVYKAAGVDRRYAWLHPLAAVMLAVICVRAALHLLAKRPITWRGTTYPGPTAPASAHGSA